MMGMIIEDVGNTWTDYICDRCGHIETVAMEDQLAFDEKCPNCDSKSKMVHSLFENDVLELTGYDIHKLLDGFEIKISSISIKMVK